MFPQLFSYQIGGDALLNSNFKAVYPAAAMGANTLAFTGLTWAYFGGELPGGITVADGALTLPANSTCSIEYESSTGVVSYSTSGWTGKTRMAVVVTGASAITSSTDKRVGLVGPAGPTGATGAQGPQGASSTWYTGNGAPASGLGIDGDMYLRTSNGDVYRKASGSWSVVGNILGPPGQNADVNTVNVYTKNQSVAPVALTPGSTIAIDASLSNIFTLAPTTNFTLANPTNLTAGMQIEIDINQPSGGNCVATYGSLYRFPGGARPALSTPGFAKDTLVARYDGTILRCNLVQSFS